MKKIFLLILLPGIFASIVLWAQSTTDKPCDFVLPVPAGPYSIGTCFLYLEDSSRHDLLTDNPDDYRSVSIQIWYPAQPEKGSTPISYYPQSVSKRFIEKGLLKEAFWADIGNQPCHSYLNAPISKMESDYPIILFSSSFVMNAHVFLFENLASHGYIVLSIGHPHWCEFYFLGDGDLYFLDKEHDMYYQALWEEELSDEVNQQKEALTLAKDFPDKEKLLTELNRIMPLENQDIRYWVEDISFVLDELTRKNSTHSFLGGRLDLDRVGMMGYSKGGATAGQACLDESRIKAGLNLSGIMFGDIDKKSLKVPFMVMENSEPWCVGCPPINDVLYHTSNSSIYMIQIEQATHGNFTDLSAFIDYLPDEGAGFMGDIDGSRFLEIEYDYILQFFDKHLKGKTSALLDGKKDKYPEVRFKVRYPDEI